MALLPEPRLKYVDDQTGLTVFQYDKMAPGRRFCDVVVIKASFALTSQGIDPMPVPGPLCLADIHRTANSPMATSLTQAGDLIIGKPGADIYFTGHVRHFSPRKWWPVNVIVGQPGSPCAQYACAVTGPRFWQHTLFKGWHLSDIEFAEEVPVQYELSYGGRKPDKDIPEDFWNCFEPNPSGSGYSFDGYSKSDTPAAPQWEQAGLLGSWKTSELVGLGPVARFWSTRSRYAGTYDNRWVDQFKSGQASDYAPDFDPRFFQCAHPALQTSKSLRGDERLELDGLIPVCHPAYGWGTRLVTKLPGWTVTAAWDTQKMALPLDTVHIDLDANQVHLVWHAVFEQSFGVESISLNLEKI